MWDSYERRRNLSKMAAPVSCDENAVLDAADTPGATLLRKKIPKKALFLS